VIALIPLVPFLGFLVNATLGRRLPKAVSGGVASAAMVVSFLLSASVGMWGLALGQHAFYLQALQEGKSAMADG